MFWTGLDPVPCSKDCLTSDCLISLSFVYDNQLVPKGKAIVCVVCHVVLRAANQADVPEVAVYI